MNYLVASEWLCDWEETLYLVCSRCCVRGPHPGCRGEGVFGQENVNVAYMRDNSSEELVALGEEARKSTGD